MRWLPARLVPTFLAVTSPTRHAFVRTATLLVLALVCLAACSSAPPFDAKAMALEWHAFMQRDYVLRSGDHLEVRVRELKALGAGSATGELVQDVVVSPTGWIDLREVPTPIQVGGRTVSSARTLIEEAYKTKFGAPNVGVSLTEAGAQSVYVCGEVGRSGPVPYQPGLTMTQAIASAGSFEITVKYSDVRILRINPDGTQRTFRVNMEDVFHDESPDFLLLPGDVVYCQTSGIADAGNWVELWIRRLLPFSLGGPALGSVN